MVKRLGLVLFAFVAGICVPPVVFAADLKVGFVNAARVIEEAPQAEAARSSLEKEFAPRDRQLVALQKSIKSQEEKFERDAAVMSEAELVDLKRDIKRKKREIQRAQDEFKEDFNIRRNEVLAQLQREAVEAIRALAEKEKYDLILSDGVLFAGKRVDITQAVLGQLRADFKKSKR